MSVLVIGSYSSSPKLRPLFSRVPYLLSTPTYTISSLGLFGWLIVLISGACPFV